MKDEQSANRLFWIGLNVALAVLIFVILYYPTKVFKLSVGHSGYSSSSRFFGQSVFRLANIEYKINQ